MSNYNDPVLLSVLQAACDATGATRALLLQQHENQLEVVAARGEDASSALGVGVPLGVGVAGFVAASGQPVALAPHSSDTRIAQDITSSLGWEPKAILTVPCAGNYSIVGVLELIDPQDNAGFNFDDVEISTLLAGVAGVALENHSGRDQIPDAATLANEIVTLARFDLNRYNQVAPMIEVLLNSV